MVVSITCKHYVSVSSKHSTSDQICDLEIPTAAVVVMGGGQSQERVVGVEEEMSAEGQPQIIVTEDFLRSLNDSESDKGAGGSGDPRGESHDSYDREDEDLPPYVSAEDLLTGAESAGGGREEAIKWKRRCELERQKNESLKNVSNQEFEKTVSEVRKKFSEKTRQNVVPVCEDCKDKVMECYRSNMGRPLNCSVEVRDYMQCVEEARKGVLQQPNTSP